MRQAREHWRSKRQPRMRQEPHRLVFLDETGTSTKMTRLRGRCLKGQRLYAKAPSDHSSAAQPQRSGSASGRMVPLHTDAAL